MSALARLADLFRFRRPPSPDTEAARAEAASQAVASLPRNGSPTWFGHWLIWRSGSGSVALAMNERGSHGDPETARQLDSLVSAIADARGDGE
jgi:hypothetical protein